MKSSRDSLSSRALSSGLRGLTVGLMVLGLCAATAIAALGTLDQSQSITPPDNSIPPRNITYGAQTFTAGTSGRLVQVDLLLSRLDPLDRNLTVQIQGTTNGRPNGTVLDSAQVTPARVPVADFPDLSFVSVPLSGSRSVGGTLYAIVLSDPAATPFGGSQYLWGSSSGNPYVRGEELLTIDGGITWIPQSGFDTGFKTYVQALPTTKDQCKDGGWNSFTQFKNQGACISFVQRNGR